MATPADLAAHGPIALPRTCYGCQRARPASMFTPQAVEGGKHHRDRCAVCRGRMATAQRDRARATGLCEWYRCERPQVTHFRCGEHLLKRDRHVLVLHSPIRFPNHDA